MNSNDERYMVESGTWTCGVPHDRPVVNYLNNRLVTPVFFYKTKTKPRYSWFLISSSKNRRLLNKVSQIINCKMKCYHSNHPKLPPILYSINQWSPLKRFNWLLLKGYYLGFLFCSEGLFELLNTVSEEQFHFSPPLQSI